jgi:hypothetical protein
MVAEPEVGTHRIEVDPGAGANYARRYIRRARRYHWALATEIVDRRIVAAG